MHLIYHTRIQKIRTIFSTFVFVLILSSSFNLAGEPQQGGLQPWPKVASQMKPWTWWWWPGSAVDSNNIIRQLKMFKLAGLGGVQIIPIYGVKGWESHNIDFLTPKWMKMMSFTVQEAHKLGLGVDMALETGWNFGGPAISGKYANAFVVDKNFILKSGEELTDTLSKDSIQALMAFGPDSCKVDLMKKIGQDGLVNWKAPAGEWHVYEVSQRFSGQDVKRAAPGGHGPMLNPFYAPAMNRYLEWFDKAFDKYNGLKPHAVFQDSYEYRCNWSPDFFSQFERMRGYKLQNFLPALFDNAPADEVARIKSDYRQTISEIMTDKTNPIWITWAHRHGFLATYQAHGAPANWLDLYAEADIPETEMFHLDRSPLISKFASSAAHVAGHPLTGAETGTWLGEHFTVTLAQLKHLTDDMFISGINHIFYHGTCYSPKSARWPGWLFYASTEMNPRNSIWHDVPELNAYVTRCQSVLQAGKPDNDILLYWPISDQWNNIDGLLQTMSMGDTSWFDGQAIGRTAHSLWNKGYTFDYISDKLLQSTKMTSGKIQTPGGTYRIILLPACNLMPVRTLYKLFTLAKSGATIIFESQLPADVPGWGHLQQRRIELKKLLSAIKLQKVEENLLEAKIGKGRMMEGDIEKALLHAGISRESLTDNKGIFFIRRALNGGKYYFLANRYGKDFNGWMTLGCRAKSVLIMDPLTGKTGIAAIRSSNNSTQVYLQLVKGASIILRIHANREIKGHGWNYFQADGTSTQITGEWHVKFISGGPALPDSLNTSKLESWTALKDTNAQRFAGTARYTITFDAPGIHSGKYFLDLGKVCQSVRVRLNGKNLGTLITPPFSMPVELKSKGNLLEVEVTNVSANRIRDLDRSGVKWKIFNDINFVDINYKPFNAANWNLYDSGLLGSVTLTPEHILSEAELQSRN